VVEARPAYDISGTTPGADVVATAAAALAATFVAFEGDVGFITPVLQHATQLYG
jgi:hypothetical protein